MSDPTQTAPSVPNPLLDFSSLPAYASITAADVEPALRAQLAVCRAGLQALLAQPAPTIATLVEPFERLQQQLSRVFAPISHLNAVVNSEALRAAYNSCVPLLAEYSTEVGQNEALHQTYQQLRKATPDLTPTQQQVLEHALRDFRLAGVGLPTATKDRFKTVMQDLDATHHWSRTVTDVAELAGLPAQLVARAAALAAQDGATQHWRLPLDGPTYTGVLTHAHHEPLRREFYEAWNTRASDRGPQAGQYDNSALMEDILRLRHEAAQLLGFANYAELSLATKMAASVSEVLVFLTDLADRYRTAATRELAELTAFAGRPLQAWDIAWYAERLKQERYAISEEALRPYFPLPRVMAGLFVVLQRLYGLQLVERTVPLWHADASYHEVTNAAGEVIGGLYMDLYARTGKRGGAWMGECIGRQHLQDTLTQPVAHLVCNFAPPGADQPALLTHSDVTTLFHEFGHALHHLLTRVDYPSLAGINGVAWDAVELPSQIMEQWCWREEALPLLSAHVETGEPLPVELLGRLLRSRQFQAGLAGARQLEFALFDFRLHAQYEPAQGGRILEQLAAARATAAVVPAPEWNRFPHAFSHIFAGGYAAGYYSYKWAEVLSADAYSMFEVNGVFDPATAQRFRDEVLACGGSREAMAAFTAFRGRKPDPSALLRQQGLLA
jgi:oligopeptidase A